MVPGRHSVESYMLVRVFWLMASCASFVRPQDRDYFDCELKYFKNWIGIDADCFFESDLAEPQPLGRDTCKAYNAKVMEITRKFQNILLKDLAKERKRTYWLGIGDGHKEGAWRYLSSKKDLTPEDYTDWAPGEPNGLLNDVDLGKAEDCAMLTESGWYDTNCFDKRYVICQQPMRFNACYKKPCQNQASCTDEEDTGPKPYTCHCPPKWTGTNCDVLIDEANQCASHPCQGLTSKCIDSQFSYKCVCALGLTGTNCERDIYECVSRPCRNGGTCAEGRNFYKCRCKPNYNGTDCEVDILSLPDTVDQCRSSPCVHASACVDLTREYKCKCDEGWEGINCERDIDECAQAPCKNLGACENLPAKYSCNCPVQWMGVQCEESYECHSAPCQFGGDCLEGKNNYTCDCVQGYTGTHCEYKIPGELSFRNCSAYVAEGSDVSCTCCIPHELGNLLTLKWDNLGSTGDGVCRTIRIQSVTRAYNEKVFICRYSWLGAEGSNSYTLRVAYGPTDADTRIQAPPSPFTADGRIPMTLTCVSNVVSPSPFVQWEGVQCDDGGFSEKCTFVPDPTVDNGTKVRCTLTNPYSQKNVAKAEYMLFLNWEENTRVAILEVENVRVEYIANDSNAPLKLDCIAIANPEPRIEVYHVPSGGAVRKLDPKQILKPGKYRWHQSYTVLSPGCQLSDSYRCDAANGKGSDSLSIRVSALCIAKSAAIEANPLVYFLFIPGFLILVAAAVAAFYYTKRRNSRAMYESEMTAPPTGELDAGMLKPVASDSDLQSQTLGTSSCEASGLTESTETSQSADENEMETTADSCV